jgi:hypothetical protein
VAVFHPVISRARRTWMALAIWPARQGSSGVCAGFSRLEQGIGPLSRARSLAITSITQNGACSSVGLVQGRTQIAPICVAPQAPTTPVKPLRTAAPRAFFLIFSITQRDVPFRRSRSSERVWRPWWRGVRRFCGRQHGCGGKISHDQARALCGTADVTQLAEDGRIGSGLVRWGFGRGRRSYAVCVGSAAASLSL